MKSGSFRLCCALALAWLAVVALGALASSECRDDAKEDRLTVLEEPIFEGALSTEGRYGKAQVDDDGRNGARNLDDAATLTGSRHAPHVHCERESSMNVDEVRQHGDPHYLGSHHHAHAHNHVSCEHRATHGDGGASTGLGGGIAARFAERLFSVVNSVPTSLAAYMSSLATALASFAGVLLLPLPTAATGFAAVAFLAFAVGALLADTMLHLLPHAYERAPHSAGHAVILGVLVFFALDRALSGISSHSHSACKGHAPVAGADDGDCEPLGKACSVPAPEKEKEIPENGTMRQRSTGRDGIGMQKAIAPACTSVTSAPGRITVGTRAASAAWLNLAADAVHNFCDGLSIGASYQVSPAAGLSTTLAVFLHEVPQELGDYMLLLRGGWSRGAALFANLVCAMSALAGTASSLRLGAAWDVSLLPFCAGGLLYMAVGTILPELGDAVTTHGASSEGSLAPTDTVRSVRGVSLTLLKSTLAVGFTALGFAIVQLIESTAHENHSVSNHSH